MKGLRFLFIALAVAAPLAIGSAQVPDEFNAGSVDTRTSPEQAQRCVQDRLRNYGNEQRRPPAECRPNIDGIEDQVRAIQGAAGTAGIYEGGSLPPREGAADVFGSGSITRPGGTAGIFGPPPPPPSQGGGSGRVIPGGIEQKQQGGIGYPRPATTPPPATASNAGGRLQGGVGAARPPLRGTGQYGGLPIYISVDFDFPLNQYAEAPMSGGDRGQYFTRFGGLFLQRPAGGGPGVYRVMRLWAGNQEVRMTSPVDVQVR